MGTVIYALTIFKNIYGIRVQELKYKDTIVKIISGLIVYFWLQHHHFDYFYNMGI